MAIREELIQDDTQAVDVGAAVDQLVGHALLRRHVRRGSDDHAGRRRHRYGFVDSFDDTEVENLRALTARHRRIRYHENVGRFQIAVNEAAHVSAMDALGDLPADGDRSAHGLRSFAHPVDQRLAVQVLHDDVSDIAPLIVTVLVELDDARMADCRDRARFADESALILFIIQEIFPEYLDRDQVMQHLVLRRIHDTHTTFAQWPDDSIAAQLLPEHRIDTITGVTEAVRKAKYAGLPREFVFPRLVLKVLAGPDAGREEVFDTGKEFGIGSAKDNQLPLTDPTVSRTHCSLSVHSAGHLIKDHGSTNGTIVNGTRVLEALVEPGAILVLGNTHIRVERAPSDVREPVPLANHCEELLGYSLPMRRLYSQIPNIARSDGPVLISGETGTGKTLLASVIHRQSPRAAGPFVVFDCASVAATLIESELFGHVAGAFTGATGERAGAFESAHGGTLFLDELGELPLELQPKLLRAVQDGNFRRVGGSQAITVNVRIIAATNRDLRTAINQERFRSDLYFRLNTFSLRVPPLRERREDIPDLVQHFFREFAGEDPPPELVKVLTEGDWPGNVRELRNAVERAVFTGLSPLGDGEPLSPNPDLFANAHFEPGISFRNAKERAVAQWETWWLRELLESHGGNLTQAARSVHMDRRHLRDLLRKYRLHD